MRILMALALETLLGVVLFLPLTLLVAKNAGEGTQLDQFTVAGRLRPEDWKRFFDLLEPLLGALVLSFLLSSLASNLAYPPCSSWSIMTSRLGWRVPPRSPPRTPVGFRRRPTARFSEQ